MMKIKDLLSSEIVPITDNKNALVGLDEKSLRQLLSEYYKGEMKVKEIIGKYKLNISKDVYFSRDLPLFYSNVKCPYDGERLVTKFPSKSSLASSSLDYYCIKCGHNEYSSNSKECSCDNCNEKEKNLERKIRDIIDDIYEDSEVELDSISIEDRLNLATLLQTSDVDFGYLIPPFWNYNTSDNCISIEIVRDLIKKDILKISKQNSLSIFSNIKDSGFSYNIEKVLLSLNIVSDEISSENELFEEIKYFNKPKFNSVDEKRLLWKKIVYKELYKMFVLLMENSKFTRELGDQKKEAKLYNAFDKWIENYTPSQIYAILYKSIKEADNKRTSGYMGNFRFNEISFIIKLSDEMIVKYEKENWAIRHYNYPKQLEINLQTKIFFSKVIKFPNWFDSKIFTNSQLEIMVVEDEERVVRNYSNYIKKREVNALDNHVISTLRSAVYYSVNYYGVVIYDGLVNCLFATKKDLWDNRENLVEAGNIKDEWTKESVEEQISRGTMFYVENSYAQYIIYLIISELISSNVPTKEQWNLKDDE
ncbi:hypothetical protein IGI37_002787 [Enterococcus sp. AZ194]|uniref:hypothetical protein n=1 Tax=Enterococcus sp. AZ194 TaxID=2774629 RepID=UPI003F258FE4